MWLPSKHEDVQGQGRGCVPEQWPRLGEEGGPRAISPGSLLLGRVTGEEGSEED